MADERDYQKELIAVLGHCAADPAFFIDRLCQVYDSEAKTWIDFQLWPAQRDALQMIHENQLTVVLKARQLGLTWLCLGYALWQMIFHPVAKPLVFSRREEDAIYLLGDERLRGMHKRLPEWLRVAMRAETVSSAARSWTLANGSVAHCFPITGGDSYTATFALADEFDILNSSSSSQEQGRLLRAVKPTIDAGGKMVLLSRSDKTKPESEFKNLYRAAKKGEGPWKCIFLPWTTHPKRDAAWYERQKADSLARTGFLDALFEQYPATDAEALAPAAADKRIPAEWILGCFQEQKPLTRKELPKGCPSVPGLEVYKLPEVFHEYVIGADPAEGNPSGDSSALTVLDLATGEEVASLAGLIQPSTFAHYMHKIGDWYNRASLCVERNNHGHAVILWLAEHSDLTILNGEDSKPGWLSNVRGKAMLYNTTCDALKDGTTTIHSFATYTQLASIEGRTLRAPEGQHDDRAISFALASQGRVLDAQWYTPGALLN